MSKKNLILAGVLAVLVIFAYVYHGPYQDFKKNNPSDENFLTGIKIDDVNVIEVGRGAATTKLEKIENKWRISGTRDFWVSDDLTGLLKNAIDSKFDLVSRNKENKKDFRVDDTGVLVKLENSGSILGEFIVGRVADDYVSSYISEPSSDKTYSIKVQGFSNVFSKSDWFDKTIFSSSSADALKVRLQYSDNHLVIEKIEDKWEGTEPYKFSVNNEKINEIIALMTNMQASEIPIQSFDGTGLDKNELIVQVSGNNGLDNTIMVGNKKDDDSNLYYAKRGNSDNIYLITQTQRDSLKKSVNELR